MSAAKPVIGFIGLGLMGEGFCKRLIAQGYRVLGHDIDDARVKHAVRLGVEPHDTPATLARAADIVLVCVTTTHAVVEVVEGIDGIASAGSLWGKVLVDHSTTDIETTKRLAATLHKRTTMAFVDGPVSGGPGAAEAGTLAIMAGGEAHAIKTVAPVMADLGRFTHMGSVGAGQATKLVNQTLVLTNYCVMAEGLRLAQSYGIDAAKIPEALASGHGGSNLLPVMFERMISNDFTPKGYARQCLKDLEMLNSAAKEQHLAMPMAAQALTLFRLLIAQGKSELDGAAVVTLYPEPGKLGERH
jgi:3-hydroxyisobutyrate dehydrogenase-like beta-hydroxyacid dehydrogenase